MIYVNCLKRRNAQTSRKIHISSIQGGGISIQPTTFSQLQGQMRAGVQQASECLDSIVRSISEISDLFIRVAEQRGYDLTECAEREYELEEYECQRLNFSRNPKAEPRKSLIGGIWDTMTNLLDSGKDFVTDGFSGNPYEALCDLSDIVKSLTTEAVELTHKPIEWGVEGGTFLINAIDRDKLKGEWMENPYRVCICRRNIQGQLRYLDSACEIFPRVTAVAFDGVKSFQDQMMYKYDPLKIRAVTGTFVNGFTLGFLQGIVNSTGNIMSGFSDGMTLLGNGCILDPEHKIISDETLNKFKDISDMMKQLDGVEKTIKRIGRFLAAWVAKDYSLINEVGEVDLEDIGFLLDGEYNSIKAFIVFSQAQMQTAEMAISLQKVLDDFLDDHFDDEGDPAARELFEKLKKENEEQKRRIELELLGIAAQTSHHVEQIYEEINYKLKVLRSAVSEDIINFDCKFSRLSEHLIQEYIRRLEA